MSGIEILAAVAGGMQIMQSFQQANAQEAAGKAQQTELNYKAQQADVAAGQERAATQRDAITQDRRTNIAISNAQAAGAAGGGSTADPSVANITGSIAAEGSYRSMAALYQGEDAARNLETGANLDTYQGDMANTAGNMKAQSTMFSAIPNVYGSKGFQTLLDKYG